MDTMIPTNTLANSTFDLMFMDDEIQPSIVDINKLTTMDMEESYYLRTVDFVNEQIRDLTESKLTLYKAISESTSDVVVLESFSDFFAKVRDIIEKFLKWIKSIYQRFVNALNSFVNNDKYIAKHKKDLDKFKDADEFKITGYEFTFSPNIPDPNAGLDWSNDLVKDLIGDANGAIGAEQVKAAIGRLDREAEYDKFRATLLGFTDVITSAQYNEELFRIYRNGEIDTDEITVDASYVRIAKNRYFDFAKTKKDIEAQMKRLDDAYRHLEKNIKDITSRGGALTPEELVKKFPEPDKTRIDNSELKGVGISSEFLYQLDVYIKNKCEQIQEFSNIHAMAFSAKLDAVKDCYKQDRATLYGALGKIYRPDSKRESAEYQEEVNKYLNIFEGSEDVIPFGGNPTVVDNPDDTTSEETAVEKPKYAISDESFIGSGFGSSIYMSESAYNEYLNNKIANESKLIQSLGGMITVKESVMLEAKASDNIKAKWNKLIEFAKGLIARFLESMSNILLDNKAYLEKYKDIILNKKPKEDLKYSYTGDYETGIQRLMNTEVPAFNYDAYKETLNQEGVGAATEQIMKANGQGEFKYEDDRTLAEQFKDFFIAADRGKSEGTFNQLEFRKMYNFCYNFEDIKNITNKDINNLEKSTAQIEQAITNAIRASKNAQPNNTPNSTANQQTGQNQNNNQGGKQQQATGESAMLEANGGVNITGQDKVAEKEKTQATISGNQDGRDPNKQNTNAVSQMTSTNNIGGDKDNTDKYNKDTVKVADGMSEEEAVKQVTEVMNKWQNINRSLIASKLTACERIATDYMDLIRAHVRSYGGKDLNDNKDNRATKQDAGNYQKGQNQGGEQQQQPAEGNAEGNVNAQPENNDQGGQQQQEQPKKRGIFRRNK